jgi:hypothetical protein
MDRAEGSAPKESGGEDVTGKAFMAAFRRALDAGSDTAALSAFKDLCEYCTESEGGYGDEGKKPAEGS